MGIQYVLVETTEVVLRTCEPIFGGIVGIFGWLFSTIWQMILVTIY